jgi:hypothetical protein
MNRLRQLGKININTMCIDVEHGNMQYGRKNVEYGVDYF